MYLTCLSLILKHYFKNTCVECVGKYLSSSAGEKIQFFDNPGIWLANIDI